MNKFVVAVAGPPNAGKGTLLSVLQKQEGLDVRIVQVSALLKAETKAGTEIGRIAKECMDAGQLVPDDIINKMILNVLKDTSSGIVILDGYPRTQNQAEAMLKAGISPDFAVEITLPDEVLIERAADRIVCSNYNCSESYTKVDPFKRPKHEGICDKCGGNLVQRSDDNPEKFRKRLEDYHCLTVSIFRVMKDKGIPIHTIDRMTVGADQRFLELFDLNPLD